MNVELCTSVLAAFFSRLASNVSRFLRVSFTLYGLTAGLANTSISSVLASAPVGEVVRASDDPLFCWTSIVNAVVCTPFLGDSMAVTDSGALVPPPPLTLTSNWFGAS